MQHAGLPPVIEAQWAVRYVDAVAASLDAVDCDALVVEEGMEEAESRWSRRRCRRRAYREGVLPQPASARAFAADDRLEVAHHRRIGDADPPPCR